VKNTRLFGILSVMKRKIIALIPDGKFYIKKNLISSSLTMEQNKLVCVPVRSTFASKPMACPSGAAA
jgi:hypothetical protein